MIRIIAIPLLLFSITCTGQSIKKLKLKGDFSKADSLQMTKAYLNARRAVNFMYNEITSICAIDEQSEENKNKLRAEQWKSNPNFKTWLGKPDRIRMAERKISKMHSKFKRNFILEVTKKNKGRCKGWISAWAIPFGKVRITLCEDFFIYRTNLQEKVLIHELGHEIGMFSHHRIHGCRAARRAATSSKKNISKRNPENYAWLAMSYLGLECSF